MLYDLKKEIDCKRAQARFVKLVESQVIIELTKKIPRSLSQNSYLHLILGWFGIETGYTTNEAKQIYKNLNKEIYFYKKENKIFVRSSADLSSDEMTKSIEIFRNYASAEAGIYLPAPHEKNFLEQIEIELSRTDFSHR